MSSIKRSTSHSELSEDEEKPSPSKNGKKSKDSPSKRQRIEWTPTEDAALIAHIRELLRLNIWAKVKDDPLLKERGSSRVLVHVDVLLKKMVNK